MKHEFFVTIYPQDTDCYDTVWHGAYFRWFETGRIEICELIGLDFKQLYDDGILLPVEVNCRYKVPARLMDQLCITTQLTELKPTSAVFSHEIKNTKTNTIILNANTIIVATDKKGNLFRRMPEFIYKKFAEICIKEKNSLFTPLPPSRGE